MTRTVRWGIFGTGTIASKMAADMVHTPSAVLAGIASRDPARARDFARRHGARRHHDSYDDLAADPEIDAIYIATPNSVHKEQACMALRAGRAVLCEKPFAMNAKEAREIAEAARQAGSFCMEAMWIHFLPVIADMFARVAAGEIGEVTLMRASVGFPADPDPANRFNDPGLGGGALLDLGVYGLSLAHRLFGAPDRVAAEAVHGPTGVDRQVTLQLGHGGKAALVSASLMANLANRLEFVGTAGRIVVEAPGLGATQSRILPFAPPGDGFRGSAPPGLLGRTGIAPLIRAAKRAITGGPGQVVTMGFPGRGYQFELEEVARCLAAGKTESPALPLADTIAVMETIDRARAAWTSG